MSDPPRKPGDDASAVSSVGAARPAKRLDGVAEIDGAPSTDATDRASAIASSADVELAEALSTGAVSVEQARERLIEEVVSSHLPADAAPELIEQVRAEVEAMLADDPTLAALLDPKR